MGGRRQDVTGMESSGAACVAAQAVAFTRSCVSAVHAWGRRVA